MKKITLLLLLLVSSAIYSQKNGITYQAIIINPNSVKVPGVNNTNAPLANKNICLQFSILDTASKTEYQETISTTTDEFGMVNTIIGSGNQSSGYALSFVDVYWNSQKSLKVAIDIKGQCSDFVEISNQLFTSVPSALSALSAENVTGVVSIESGGTNAITVLGAKINFALENVDNTSDLNKPISLATQTALNLKENSVNKSLDINIDGTSNVKYPTSKAVKTYVDANASISSAALNTEINRATAAEGILTNNLAAEVARAKATEITNANAIALNTTAIATNSSAISAEVNRAKVAENALENTLAQKANLESPSFTGTVSGITKTMVGLGNLDNTTDLNKPVSTATNTALNLKVDKVAGERLINASEITNLSNQSGINTGDQDLSALATTASTTTALNLKVDKVAGERLINATEITNLSNQSGINTGDQDLSALATNANLDLKVDKVAGERLINATEITNLSNQSGINTGDQDLSALATTASTTTALNLKVDKVTGERLINATEITNLSNQSGINTGDQDLSALATNANLDLKVDKVAGERLINATEITNLSNQSGINTGDQDLSALATNANLNLKVDKVTGERLINATEITNLSNQSGINTGDQDLSALATTASTTTALNLKVDKVVGERLINASEITNLSNQSGINTGDQDLSALATTASTTTALNLKVDKVAGERLINATEITTLSNQSGINTGDQDLSALATTASTTTALNLKVDKVTGERLINATEITNLSNQSGINTGDQDLSALATNANLNLKVDKVTGERLINATEITNLSNQSGINTGDQDLSALATTASTTTALNLKVDKVVGERLINASEITNLSNQSGINTGDQDLSALATTASTTTALNLKVDKVTGERLINATEITNLSNQSGINTGDQDLSALATNANLDLKVDKVAGERLINATEITNLSNQSGINTGDQDLSSFATTTALNLKANIASPTFTGIPAAPTAVAGANSAQVATTEFVSTAITGKFVDLTTNQTINGVKTFIDGIKTIKIDASAALDQENTNSDGGAGGSFQWQSFTANITGILSAVEWQMSNPTSPYGTAANVTVKIYQGEGVSGALLGTAVSLTPSDGTASFINFNLDSQNINTVSGSVYTIELTTPSVQIGWLGFSNSNSYSLGRANNDPNWDYIFKTYVKGTSEDSYAVSSLSVPYTGATGPVDLGAYDLKINGANFGTNGQFGSIGIGINAGSNTPGQNTVAIGNETGIITQGSNAVAIGAYTAGVSQGSNAVAVGYQAAYTNQGASAVAIGNEAALTNQGDNAIAIGSSTGSNNQGSYALAIGGSAGNSNQGSQAIAMGTNSGNNTQGSNAIAVGNETGYENQGSNSVAVGAMAGKTNQGANSIAIGSNAGKTNQNSNSIILNATGNDLDTATSGFFVDPISNVSSSTALFYDTTTKEITYGSLPSVSLTSGVTGILTVTNGGSGVNTSTGTGSLVLSASPTFTGTVSGITKTMVGLANVDNTTDANKPVSTAAQTALDLKANIDSPIFTGTPTLPSGTIGVSQTAGDNTTSLATTAFVSDAITTVGSNFVDLTNDQTIAGAKIFSSDLKVNGSITANAEISSEITSGFTIDSSNAEQFKGKVLICNPSNEITITFSNDLPLGFNCMVLQKSSDANKINFIGGSGVSMKNRNNFTATAGNYAIATIVNIGGGIIVTAGDMQ